MYCKKCGKEIESSTSICPNCGEINNPSAVEGQEQASKLFLEADEKLLAQMSRSYASNFLIGGTLSSDYVVLSDRRMYYSGKYIGRVGRAKLAHARGNIILPLEQISSALSVRITNIGMLIWGALLSIAGIVVISSRVFRDFQTIGILALIAGIVLILVALFLKRHYFIVSTGSESIRIDYRMYGEDRIQEFSKKLGATITDHIRELRHE